LIALWVKLLKVPYRILFPLILLFCLIGAYGINNSVFDVYVMAFFGGVGYVLRKYDYEFAPWALGFVLGPTLESAFRQSLVLSDGSFLIFVQRPIVAALMCISVAILVTGNAGLFRRIKGKLAD
jgi:putative tricarboxylic transport membrane protein